MTKVQENIEKLIKPTIESMDFDYVGCEYLTQGRFTVLRVYIDKEAGITADDCGLVSRQLSAVLDVEALISGRYTLEVSSPGLDRPLFALDDFKKFIGHQVKIKVRTAIEGQKNFIGVIDAVDDEAVMLKAEETPISLSFSNITKANLVPMI